MEKRTPFSSDSMSFIMKLGNPETSMGKIWPLVSAIISSNIISGNLRAIYGMSFRLILYSIL